MCDTPRGSILGRDTNLYLQHLGLPILINKWIEGTVADSSPFVECTCFDNIKNHSCYQIEKNEMGGHVARMGRGERYTGLWRENLR
jgi:hypothetical protein